MSNVLAMTRGDMTSFEDIVHRHPYKTVQVIRLAELIIARATNEHDEQLLDKSFQKQIDALLAELNSCDKLIDALSSGNSSIYQRILAHRAQTDYPRRFAQLLLKLDFNRVQGLSPLAMSVLTSNDWTEIKGIFFEGTSN